MTVDEIGRRLDVARQVAAEAGALTRGYFDAPERLMTRLKGPQDYLTEADGASERLIVGRLLDAFPDDGILGEEEGGTPKEQTWIIDPIDGTANFARGVPHWAISIGFAVGRTLELGVVFNPATGIMYVGRRGHGATRNGQPIRVSGATAIDQAIVETGWSRRRPTSDYTKLIGRMLDMGAAFRRQGSAAMGLAMVADGRSDGYTELHINSWDVAAGIVLVREAGGWATDFLAGDGLTQGGPIVACTPALREAIERAAGP